MKNVYLSLILFLTLLLPLQAAWAQGITTSSMAGTITDASGSGLPGATIVAVHTPSGTQYATSTLGDGRFTIPNMRVGGPYTVRVTFVGYSESVLNNLNLALGQALRVDVRLTSGARELGEVVVSGVRNELLGDERTGAATNVSREVIESLPTISRSLSDFTRLSPLANTSGAGTSFAGTSNRYNQFAIDGIVNNDVFGLSNSGTNGGQTGIQPISLDAIEEFQINIAPYDVRQGGFTGGGINAVTRSGTNTFQGSVYFFGNNQELVGRNNPNSDARAKYPEYIDYQRGIRLGGPIIKDKLFFFVNAEQTKNVSPLPFDPTVAGSGSLISMDELNRIISTINRIAPNFDPGAFGGIDNETNSRKLLGKIDWNINENHRLTLRHNYVYGENFSNNRGNNFLRFGSNGVYFPSTTNSTGLELNSTFGGRFSNNLLIGYTKVEDDREPNGSPFPQVRINNLSNNTNVTFGGEASSVANLLTQDIFSFTDNFSIYRGKHTFTVGTHNEFYKFYNLFVQNIYGSYVYNTLAAFESIGTPGEIAPSYFQRGYSFADDGPSQSQGAGQFSAMQLGLYGQDEIQVTDRFNVTIGLRADLPIFNDSPPNNIAFATALEEQGLSTNQLPKTRVLWSPRVGFNLDVLGDNTFKLRGGTGLFTGRVPFVWISNQYSNNGTLNGTFNLGNSNTSSGPITNPAGVRFNPDPFNQPDASDFNITPGLGDINVTATNYKFPQTFRSNLGIDKQLPGGIVATVEALYSKSLNNITFTNLNRQENTNYTFEGPDQRPRYNNLTPRPYTQFNEIIVLGNTNKGYTMNLVFQLQKQFESGFAGSAAYTYGRAKDVFPATSSTAYSNWRFLNSINGPNNPEAAFANFDLRHRVSGFVSYKKEYFKTFATQISLFYNGQTGQPISYLYNGDLNNDGTNNDVIYVPRDRSEINLVAVTGNNPLSADQQWEALNAFIENDPYLSTRRGQYAERNAARLPFQHQFDLRLLQDLGFTAGGTSHKFQLTFDVMNVGNLLNRDWGRQYFVSNQGFELIRYAGLASGATATTGRPTFQYTGAGQTAAGNVYTASDLSSRWRGQIGLRYLFN